MSDLNGSSDRSSSSRFQFRLRSLLILVTVVCILLGLSSALGFELILFYPLGTILLFLGVSAGLLLFLLIFQIPITWVLSKFWESGEQDELPDGESTDSQGTVAAANSSKRER